MKELIEEILKTLNIIDSGPGIHNMIQTMQFLIEENYDLAFDYLCLCKKTVNFDQLIRNPKFDSFVSIINGKMSSFVLFAKKLEMVGQLSLSKYLKNSKNQEH